MLCDSYIPETHCYCAKDDQTPILHPAVALKLLTKSDLELE